MSNIDHNIRTINHRANEDSSCRGDDAYYIRRGFMSAYSREIDVWRERCQFRSLVIHSTIEKFGDRGLHHRFLKKDSTSP
ncbi:hypothetical protein TNCV_2037851 [Trichonephila clavipes]|nr:hypothetical protein TNCV_2037851 [Trichonephila clavipes]